MNSTLPRYLVDLIDYARSNLAEAPILRQMSTIDLTVQPEVTERRFQYDIRMAYIFGQGCAYAERGSTFRGEDLVGMNALDHLHAFDRTSQIAVMDALFAKFPKKASDRIVLEGEVRVKSEQRPAFYSRNIVAKLGEARNKRVLMIGLVKAIARDLASHGISITVTDLDAQAQTDAKVEQGHSDRIQFIHPDSVSGEIGTFDLVLATGMTLANGTFQDVSNLCRGNGVPLMLYAETAAHLAPFTIGRGADYVIAEYFPFFVFGGSSVIEFFDTDQMT